MVFICKIDVKCQYAGRTLWAYAYVFQKRPGCALIGACVLIRTNAVMCLLRVIAAPE